MAWLRINWHFIFLAVLAAGALFIWSLNAASSEDTFLSFWMLDVGQGDALFIETPDRYQILVDGGPNANVVQRLGEIMPFWDRTIDLIVLTHPHADHVSGLIEVLKRYEVGAVLESGAVHDGAEYALWKDMGDEEGAEHYIAEAGMEIKTGTYASLTVLAPFESAEGRRFKNIHDASVVLLLDYRDTEFLLTGDAEEKIERGLLQRGALSDVEVLKVGHHGSRTSTSPGFLALVRPEYALISAGEKNRYGHPHAEVVERLEAFGSQLFRTDITGTLRLQSDGTHVYQQ